MEPLVALLLELGSRAKSAEAVAQAQAARIAELEAKIAELTPKEVAAEPQK